MRESETDRQCAHKYRTNMLPNGERDEPRERARVMRMAVNSKCPINYSKLGRKKKQNTKQVVCVWKMDSRVVERSVYSEHKPYV